MAKAVTNLTITTEELPASVNDKLITKSDDFATLVQNLQTYIGQLAGVKGGRVRARVDSSTGVAATVTVTCDQSAATAGDDLIINGYSLAGVASGADATAGQWDIGASDSAMATNLTAAINGVLIASVRNYVTATASTADVIITARATGTAGNSITIAANEASGDPLSFTGTTLAGGINDGTTSKALTVTITHANVGSSDTITIGGTTLTWDTEMAIGADATEDATNLAAEINTNATLQGVFSASSNAGVVTITAVAPPNYLKHTVLQTNDATAMALSAATFATGGTEAYVADSIELAKGVA